MVDATSYIQFASKISFYELLQDEFKPPHIDIEQYSDEIELLSKDVNIEQLTNSLHKRPRIIDVLEELLQLKRFTNTQYINFCFDVQTLNNSEESVVINYINKAIMNYENGKPNESFLVIYRKLCKNTSPNNTKKLFYTKRAIVKYIELIIRKRKILYSHIHNSIGTRLRISRYVIEQLNVDRLLKAVKLSVFLIQKRHPKDTKGLHGNFGSIKIQRILDDAGLQNVTSLVRSPINLTTPLQSCPPAWVYTKEMSVKGIDKRKDGKPKVFDYVLLHNRTPKVLIETNFYSTSGTKIGINQGEYVDLLEDIQKINEKQKLDLKFIWVTDGNYWLTPGGEDRYNNLKSRFFRKEFGLINYKLLHDLLPQIMASSS